MHYWIIVFPESCIKIELHKDKEFLSVSLSSLEFFKIPWWQLADSSRAAPGELLESFQRAHLFVRSSIRTSAEVLKSFFLKKRKEIDFIFILIGNQNNFIIQHSHFYNFWIRLASFITKKKVAWRLRNMKTFILCSPWLCSPARSLLIR